uniref:Uncharacterized protein n=1 Tax=Dulem virus 40 TaxID=3145758 RepID=A0AAU8AXX6_9CAUD
MLGVEFVNEFAETRTLPDMITRLCGDTTICC